MLEKLANSRRAPWVSFSCLGLQILYNNFFKDLPPENYTKYIYFLWKNNANREDQNPGYCYCCLFKIKPASRKIQNGDAITHKTQFQSEQLQLWKMKGRPRLQALERLSVVYMVCVGNGPP